MSDNHPKIVKRAISMAARHALMMHRRGHLSNNELDQFKKFAISEALRDGMEEHEYDGMTADGSLEQLRQISAHDDNEHPEDGDNRRRLIALKVIANLLSDPVVRDVIGTDALDHLKTYGIDPGEVDEHELDEFLDGLYERSCERDRPIAEDDPETSDEIEALGDGTSKVYGDRGRRRA